MINIALPQAFKPGHTPWNKGKKMSVFHRSTLMVAQKAAWRDGVYTEERNQKISKALKGRKQPPRSLEHSMKIAEALRGRKASPETREKMRLAQLGENSHRWKGGLTNKNSLIRKSGAYREWRKAVFERDNYTCQGCGKTGVELNADHIKPFSKYPELRFEVNNGQTVCVPCHKEWGWNRSKE